MAANLAAVLVILNRTNIVEPTIRKLDHLITGHKKCPKNDHLNTGLVRFSDVDCIQIKCAFLPQLYTAE
jgi:hypothetical protein